MTPQTTQNSARKPLKTIQELTAVLREDCFYFVSVFSAGDIYYLCLLQKVLESKLQGKIIFVIKPSHQVVLEMFESDYIVCENSLMELFLKTPECFEFDGVVSTPTLGKLFPAHESILQKQITYTSALNWNLQWLDLPLDTKGNLPTNLPQIEPNLKAKLDAIAPLHKIVLICPEAKSCPSLPPVLFKAECQKWLEKGYKVVVNLGLKSTAHHQTQDYERYFTEGVYDLNLSLKELIALALSCARVVSVRSGFCDIIAPHCEDLKVYYTNFVYWWQARLKEINPTSALKEVFIYDEPIYKHFLREVKNGELSLPLKLYKRYTTKGFLRRVRLPFTLYFKIYLKHKNEAQNELSKDRETSKFVKEFVQNDFSQTYEFRLGLLLQKACENFWRGGFLAFPFAYLKLRKKKRELQRVDENAL